VSKDTQISIRLEPELVARFERLVQKLGGAASRAALVRMAMLAGLPEVEERYSGLPDDVGRATSRKKR
jgi:predicted DNA-binding protein